MHPILRNTLAVAAGILVGGSVNMGIVMISGSIIPPPDGVDPTNMESIADSFHLYQPKHFLMPFLAHAIGTLVGAYLTAKIAVTHQLRFAMLVGLFYLIGGYQMSTLLPAPLWFDILDLSMAYLPMGWLGWKLAEKQN